MLSAFRLNAKPSTSTISVILWGLCLLRNGCCCSVTKLCLTLCDPMGCNMPGFSVPHYLLEFAQTHIHWVSDTIQPSHPLLPHSTPALNLSQHQSLFQWVGSFFFFLISWRLITLQYCSGFCHPLTWISRGYTCIPHPNPPSHLPLHPIPLGLPRAPGPSTCLMHPTWAGDLFHPR